ncbi:MAG: hypothetical protein J6I47_01240 [Ruminococcus sp.]|nr:hypothetical protein [Ruminococcus sp.]
MKRLIALMSAAIIAAGMFTSCRKTYPYDTDKAISLATEYMKDKYGKDIKDVETYKKTHGSDAYIGVKFKLDETDAETPDTNTYEVRVYVDGEDEENHYVKCDDYMNSYVKPFFDSQLNQVIKDLGVDDFVVFTEGIHENGTKLPCYYYSSFEIPNKTNTLNDIAQEYCLIFGISIKLPRNEVDKLTVVYDDVFQMFSDKLQAIFKDDIFRLYLTEYEDEAFSSIKAALLDEGVVLNNYEPYYSKEEYFNSKS